MAREAHVAVGAGLLTFVLLPNSLHGCQAELSGLLGSICAIGDTGLLAFLCSLGVGSLAYVAWRRLGWRRTLAGSVSAVVALFVIAVWGLWMRMGLMADLGRGGSLRQFGEGARRIGDVRQET